MQKQSITIKTQVNPWQEEGEKKENILQHGVEEQVEEDLDADEGPEEDGGDEVGRYNGIDEKRFALYPNPRKCWPVVQWQWLQENQILYRACVGKADW